MIIQLMMNKEDIRASCITYSFLQTDCRRKIATASRNWGEPVRLYVEGDTIEFAAMPAFVDRLSLRLPYPESLKGKRAIGYRVTAQGKTIACFYGSAMTCGKKGLFKRNIGLTIFGSGETPYGLVRVGFYGESVHYYCLFDDCWNTVAIIERHTGDDCAYRATIYVEEERHCLMAMIACTEEVIWVENSGDLQERVDVSAGPYISRYEEEKALFDRAFLERVKLYV